MLHFVVHDSQTNFVICTDIFCSKKSLGTILIVVFYNSFINNFLFFVFIIIGLNMSISKQVNYAQYSLFYACQINFYIIFTWTDLVYKECFSVY